MERGGAILAAALLLCPPPAAAEPLWPWLLPGGGQYMLGQKGKAAAYAGGTLSLAGWGAWASTRKTGPEVNAPLVYAQQLYVLSIYDAYKDMRLAAPSRAGPPPDPSSVPSLMAAPFRREQLRSPWVIGSAALGAGLNLLVSRTRAGRRGYASLRRVRYLGDSFNREWGLAAYSAYWIPVSLGAGTAEEALFRGMIQNEWEARWGERRGWAAASGLFGLAHLSKPSSAESWGQAGFAAAAGLFLGWRYQRTGYRLAEPVAAHFWFDLAAGLALFLDYPSQNPLGARVDFAF